MRWRGVTGFRLLEFIAHGREGEAIAFLDWAVGNGVTVVRVLTMANGLFRLTPEDGRAALPRLLELANVRGLKVEAVALADTANYNLDLHHQVSAVATVGGAFDSRLVELANEHYHGTQQSALHDVGFVHSLQVEIPAGVLYTEGTTADDEALDLRGAFGKRHLDRGRDGWNQVRRVRELENVSRSLGIHVVDDERIGAGEQEIPGKRWNHPPYFFGFGILGRGFELGSTFHYEDGLQARIPSGRQLECFAAWLRGFTLLPADNRYTFQNANNTGGWPQSPVRNAAFEDTVIRVYSFVGADPEVTVVVGVTGDPRIEWQNGYRPVGVLAEMHEIQVLEIRQG